MIALYFDLILGGKVNVARDQHLLVEIRICISVIVCGGDDDYTSCQFCCHCVYTNENNSPVRALRL